jgi:trigger factor
MTRDWRIMNVTKEILKDNKIKLTIEVEAGKLALASDAAYAKLAPSVKVAGFRPGKAPKNIVEKEIGSERWEAEMLDIILPESYYEAVMSEKLEVVGSPEVKVIKFVPSDGLTYEATVETMPEFKLPDVTKIQVKRQTIKVIDTEIQEVLDDLAKQLSKTAKVERAAKLGDKVEIDFEGFIGGVPFDGGKSQNHPIVLGSGSFIPGFEDQVVGMKADEERDIEVSFPDDYHADNLKGKKATFKVKLHQVEETILPEITDTFATQVGPFKDLPALKVDIEKQLVHTKEIQERRRIEDEILAKLVEKTKFTAPNSLVAQEQQRMLHEAESNLAQQGIQMPQYLEMIKKTLEDIQAEMKPEAEKRVKVGIVLTQVAKEGSHTATAKEIEESIARKLELYTGPELEQAESYFKTHEAKHQVENSVVGQKVLDYLYETCSK